MANKRELGKMGKSKAARGDSARADRKTRSNRIDLATEREVRALIARVQATSEDALSSSLVTPATPAAGEELEAREQQIREQQLALEKEMQIVKRQRAAVQLQRRERELREVASTALKAEEEKLRAETDRRVEELRRDLERREQACEVRRTDLKTKMEQICAEYEAAVKQASQLREAFDAACQRLRSEADDLLSKRKVQSDDTIRRQLETEALALGFRISPRNTSADTLARA